VASGTLLALLDPDRLEGALASHDVDEELPSGLDGAFRAHATPTELAGGQWRWAIPARAWLGIAGRVMPGETRASWLADFEAITGPLGEHTLSDFETGIETPESPTFDDLAGLVRRHAPDAVVLPSLAPGSDLQHPSRAGAETYGYFPLYPEPGVPSIWDLAHAVDERISIANLMRCVRNAWDLICIQNGLPLD
jgi:acetylornithine deacetylase/succinyl-diaminopimelate desuccinylase-like protein